MKKDLFLIYLKEEKRAAENTSSAYVRDILQFESFVGERGITDLEDVINSDVVAFLMDLKSKGSSKSTVNRKLASVRTYYAFLQKRMGLKNNPADNIKSPKIEKKAMEFLKPEEVDKLMELPDDTDKGIRDKAILELLYATGIRASELIDMEIADINLRMGFVTCEGENIRSRIIPVGRMARNAVEKYLEE